MGLVGVKLNGKMHTAEQIERIDDDREKKRLKKRMVFPLELI